MLLEFHVSAETACEIPHKPLAAMNEDLGVTTLLLPAKPGLAAMSSTVLRGLAPDSLARATLALVDPA